MNRAMFSGVAGMKAHQTKMDVIGNNIANVNTFGYKSQRAVFSDVYYQTIKSASGGTTNRGGTNPSSVGYGSSLTAIQAQMTQSSLQNTGFGMDVAITGEGFLQVMDADGNIFYTKAGMLDYDSNGYLTDINGNFVLGAASADGKPGTQKIKLDNIGSVDPTKPEAKVLLNGINYTLTASNPDKAGNVGISFGSSSDIPDGLDAVATISTSGAINVLFRESAKFASLDEVNAAMNKAITEANGGKTHPAGTFTLTADKTLFGEAAVPGGWSGKVFANKATLTLPDMFFNGAFSLESTDMKTFPKADGTDNTPPFTLTSTGSAPNITYTMATTINGVTYTSDAFKGDIGTGTTINLKAATPDTGSISLKVKDSTKLAPHLATAAGGTPVTQNAAATPPVYFMGGTTLQSVSSNFTGTGKVTFTMGALQADGTYTITATTENGKKYEGTVNLTNGGSVKLTTTPAPTDPALSETMTLTIPNKATIISNMGLKATAGNTAPTDTEIMTALGNTLGTGYQDLKMIAYTPAKSMTLTGKQLVEGNFGIKSGTITGMDKGGFGGGMTIKKTSSNFSASGKVDDFFATYNTDDTGTPPNPFWSVTVDIGGKLYKADISKDTVSSSILLKGDNGEYIEVNTPGFDAISKAFSDQNGGAVPSADGQRANAFVDNTLDKTVVTPSEQSKDLGLGTNGFTLAGGTAGGTITLDQLSSIAIGSDGTVTVSHPDKGNVVAGRISLATFANPSGLQLEGSNYYSVTANSGDPKLADPGSNGAGGLKSSALEMSNVDLSAEFADMITTQRGFQANSRIITVSDTMLEELINLKR